MRANATHPDTAGRLRQAALAIASLTLTLSLGAAARAEAPGATGAGAPANGTIEADGTVQVPSFRLPPSMYLSEEARAALPRKPTDPE